MKAEEVDLNILKTHLSLYSQSNIFNIKDIKVLEHIIYFTYSTGDTFTFEWHAYIKIFTYKKLISLLREKKLKRILDV